MRGGIWPKYVQVDGMERDPEDRIGWHHYYEEAVLPVSRLFQLGQYVLVATVMGLTERPHHESDYSARRQVLF
ncbi:MAG: hypothetical protein E2P07_00705 [Acidobacteria bacterium]|nr:MAG: hypothetical protein E2P07_00705 [Acidobacteriota bacterium]